MEMIANISQIIPNLCTWISKQTGYVRHLKNNVDALMEEADKLQARFEDTEKEGREASGGRQRLTSQARTWLGQARPILAEIENIKSQFDQRRTFCNGCFPDLCSDYTLGKRAFKKLEPVRRFINDGNGIQLLAISSSPSVVKRDVEDLMVKAKTLKAQCDDMESKGREASRKRMRLTNQAQIWLGHARAILTEIENIKSEFDRRQASNNGIFPDLPTLGKRAVEKLESVRRLINERSSIQLVAMSSPPRVMKMDVPTVGQSSAQRNMDNIWDLLHDEHTSVICIYGMGGVGKTTLMKAINKKLEDTSEFDYVIWVTVSNVSKELISERVQQEIMGRLQLSFREHDSYSIRSMQLREYLTNKRYMLILDDLWNSINLSEIGIPTNKENGSKIAITTRLFEVCNDMKADARIRVSPLPEAEAWDLFAANVGKEVVHQPHIKDVAKAVLMECGGLPLAIMIVAKAMQGEKKKELWRDALRALLASVPEIRGMEPLVILPLKLSYDDLRDEKVKMCFLYCSLFPEDEEISVRQLIRWWIMEGFIDNVDNLVAASNKGHRIVEELKHRCLLEEGIIFKNRVKMHDIIRRVARYIASPSSNEGPIFSLKANVRLDEQPPVETWRERERVSLIVNYITELPVRPECPNLISLKLSRNYNITAVPRSFFEIMPALQVLDLTSNTSITSLSVSSSLLLNLRALILRDCRRLTEVPFLGQLKELQFLDIKSTAIIRLPEEMENLVKLKKLNMSDLLSDSITIPSNVISGLSSLEDLRMRRTNVIWAEGSEFAVENDVTLGEVGKLKRLTILKITIKDFDCVEEDVFPWRWSKLKIFKVSIGPSDHNHNMNCMKQMQITGGNNYPRGVKVMVTHTEGLKVFKADVKDVSQLIGDANGLRMLDFHYCEKMECILDWSDVGENALQNIEELRLVMLPSLQKLFEGEVPQRCLRKLNEIYLFGCDNLKSLFSSEMVQNLDQLQTLHVRRCDGLEEIIEGHDKSLPENPFQQLRKFTLLQLPKLKSIIHRDTLALPSLIKLNIRGCPDLRLPKRPDTTDWPSITQGDATWQRLDEEYEVSDEESAEEYEESRRIIFQRE